MWRVRRQRKPGRRSRSRGHQGRKVRRAPRARARVSSARYHLRQHCRRGPRTSPLTTSHFAGTTTRAPARGPTAGSSTFVGSARGLTPATTAPTGRRDRSATKLILFHSGSWRPRHLASLRSHLRLRLASIDKSQPRRFWFHPAAPGSLFRLGRPPCRPCPCRYPPRRLFLRLPLPPTQGRRVDRIPGTLPVSTDDNAEQLCKACPGGWPPPLMRQPQSKHAGTHHQPVRWTENL